MIKISRKNLIFSTEKLRYIYITFVYALQFKNYSLSVKPCYLSNKILLHIIVFKLIEI